ncbi:MAG: CinA family nicotinamide mononucleotide deamidase-related protein [Anaerococcus hydrogenalis]|uniref:CinA family nicotinamide mononucleotide deamidase-related protein n=1 Tax=Anaerococcus hydrogenalis TaxID=33029 RepID=UPI0028FE3B34|nr:CinA family nicotinamide mononucleotide deamidase-related protein [Anaerococcus hydrogenalis]MDU2582682.1 CinA family nicotinamide mononucleotide deamidase-related protein [Anaerococcus hydrogenalis]
MKAHIISVGTEILLGNITDTNSKYLANKLTELGIDVFKMTTVGDNPDRLFKAMKEAVEEVDYVFTTGGLGPTEDDITKEIAIKVLGQENQVCVDQRSKQRLESYFSNKKKAMNVNIKQAMFPKDAIILDNDRGTAPGCILKNKIILLPGPPREMNNMFENKLLKHLNYNSVIKSRNLKIALLGEWDMANRIDLTSKNPTISPYFDNQGGYLRITAKAKNNEEADRLLDKKEKEVKEVFKSLLISDDSLRKEETLINLLKERDEKISTAESVTGGLIASSIIDISGASEVIEESFITYSDRVKEKTLNVSRETLEQYGAVSYECALEMLDGLHKLTNSNLCIISTGYANKGEIFLGLKYRDKKVIKKFKFSADRNKARLFAKNRAMDLAILMMRGKYEDNIDI